MNQITPLAAHPAPEPDKQADRGFWPGEGPAFTRDSLDKLLIWA